VARLAAAMGRPLMPWQRQVADTALEVDAAGHFVYPLVVVTVPRQSGKTVTYSVVGQHRALTMPRARVWFCMQTGEDARDWFLNEHLPLMTPFDAQLQVRRSNGSEHTRWRYSGGTFRPFSPTSDALHGKTTDLVIVDEAWAFDPIRGRELDAAIIPTQATRPGAQVWKFSTAGTDASTWLLASVEAGRAACNAGKRSGLAYFEWAISPELDPTEPDSWPLYHPAYGRTIARPAMEAALQLLGPEEFSRAYGNKWLHTTARVIPHGLWLEAARGDQLMPAAGDLALAFDVALDRSDAAIVVFHRDEGGCGRAEVAEHAPGAGWVVDRLKGLAEKWNPVAVGYDAAGPAVDVADQARRAGLEVEGLGAADYAAACAGLLQGLVDHTLTYRPHPALDDAAAAAGRRTLGDRWAWGRRTAGVSIAALTAATVAAWSYDHAPAAAGRFKVF
jgi:hypothetical protein